jgi:electron transfer flavoprotein alpha subunit
LPCCINKQKLFNKFKILKNMSVLVFVDSSEGKLHKAGFEAVYYGSKIASQKSTNVTAITYGGIDAVGLSKLGNYGATKVLVGRNITGQDDQQLTRLIAQAVADENAEIIIFSHDPKGKAIAPRLSARLKAGLVAGAIDFPEINGVFSVKKNVFSGKAIANYVINTEKKIISLLPNSVQPTASENVAEVVDYNPETGAANLVIKEMKKEGGALSLPEAELVVSAGRGMRGPENWGIVEELAKELGAATACSRPVADIGWRPHHEHVGQTGVAIRPNLYIAIGISGAIQHLAGVNGSKVIVVINSDPEAPFFKAADYGIVGDAFEILPKLTAAVKQFNLSK